MNIYTYHRKITNFLGFDLTAVEKQDNGKIILFLGDCERRHNIKQIKHIMLRNIKWKID